MQIAGAEELNAYIWVIFSDDIPAVQVRRSRDDAPFALLPLRIVYLRTLGILSPCCMRRISSTRQNRS